MKTKLLLVVVLITAYLSKMSAQCTEVVNIPDANFKNALLKNYAINKNKDNEIQCSEAKAYTGKINVSGKNISDLTGIEEFLNLTGLTCSSNKITTLDVSKNTKLTFLGCYNTNLTTLDVSKNTNLTRLYCFNNKLTTLDVSKSTKLTSLDCSTNKINTLDVSKNTKLMGLNCSYNKLTALNVSKNTNLTSLYCSYNKLATLDVSKNTKLTSLWSNKNPKLTCIKIAENFTPSNGWSKPKNAVWSTNCASTGCTGVVNIPDANLKKALLEDYAIDKNKDNEIQCSEAKAYKGKINVSGKNISDLTGIEEFVNLTSLDCSYNKLTTLDVSKNTKLTSLDCSTNKINTLDVSKNTKLTYLNCSTNKISTLELSKNTKLTSLYCSTNKINTLELSKNTKLTELYCSYNSLTTLDVSKNTELVALFCLKNPKLTCIKMKENFTPPSNSNWRKPTNSVWNTNCATASINNETFTSAITIYPNPANNVISVNSNIKLSRVDIGSTTIYGDYLF